MLQVQRHAENWTVHPRVAAGSAPRRAPVSTSIQRCMFGVTPSASFGIDSALQIRRYAERQLKHRTTLRDERHAERQIRCRFQQHFQHRRCRSLQRKRELTFRRHVPASSVSTKWKLQRQLERHILADSRDKIQKHLQCLFQFISNFCQCIRIGFTSCIGHVQFRGTVALKVQVQRYAEFKVFGRFGIFRLSLFQRKESASHPSLPLGRVPQVD